MSDKTTVSRTIVSLADFGIASSGPQSASGQYVYNCTLEARQASGGLGLHNARTDDDGRQKCCQPLGLGNMSCSYNG